MLCETVMNISELSIMSCKTLFVLGCQQNG
jgi:hypothetical protein